MRIITHYENTVIVSAQHLWVHVNTDQQLPDHTNGLASMTKVLEGRREWNHQESYEPHTTGHIEIELMQASMICLPDQDKLEWDSVKKPVQ